MSLGLQLEEGTMAAYWLWWIAAALLVGVELISGTFYLLALGIAVAVGGVGAWLGMVTATQFFVAGAAGVVLVFLAHRWRKGHTALARQVSLDVGALVHVDQWHGDGTARVVHRGTTWDAELENPDTPRADSFYVVATRGSVLVLSDHRP